MKPMSPKEVRQNTVDIIPPFVFDVVNNLLCSDLNSKKYIKQKNIIAKIKKHPDYDTDLGFEISWLNFEEAYRENGWKVKYDKPHYTENYDACFIFTPKD